MGRLTAIQHKFLLDDRFLIARRRTPDPNPHFTVPYSRTFTMTGLLREQSLPERVHSIVWFGVIRYRSSP